MSPIIVLATAAALATAPAIRPGPMWRLKSGGPAPALHLEPGSSTNWCAMRAVRTVQALLRAHAARDSLRMSGWLANDFRFHCHEPAFERMFPDGLDRDAVLGPQERVIQGWMLAGCPVPFPDSIDVSVATITAGEPDHGSTVTVTLDGLIEELVFPGGLRVRAGPVRDVFVVEGAGEPRRPQVRRWDEWPAPGHNEPAAPAEDALPSGGAPAPIALAIAPLGNPVWEPLQVWLSVPAPGPVQVELLDVAGRRVREREVAIEIPGVRGVTLPCAAPLAPGVYWLRARDATRTATTRVVVLR
jgi:hypothetical protein